MVRSALILSENLHNIGDYALLKQCIYGLRLIVGIERIGVRLWNPPPKQISRQLAAEHVDIIGGKQIPRALYRSMGALVMIGGGQAIRQNSSVASIYAMDAMSAVTRLTGGTLVAIGCGASTISRQPHLDLWRRILGRLATLSVRDTRSRQTIEKIANIRAELTSDLAFMPSPLHALLRRPALKSAILIAPCEDLTERRSVDAIALARCAIANYRRLGLSKIYLVCHDVNLDIAVCAKIETTIREADPSLEVATVAGYNLEAYAAAYASSVAVVTNRLHSAIFGILANCHVTVIDDGTAKMLAISDRFSLHRSSCTTLISEDLTQKIRHHMESEPDALRNIILDTAKREAQESFAQLRDLFAPQKSAEQSVTA